MIKKYLLIVAIVVVIFSALLFFYPLHLNSLYGVSIASDAAGGAYVIYENKLGGNIYAERISSNGEKAWNNKILLGKNTDRYIFNWTQIVGDKSGVIISYPLLAGNGLLSPGNKLMKLDVQGNKLWQKDVGSIKQLVSDGTGGAILAISTYGNLSLNRIDSSGNSLWEKQTEIPPNNYVSSITSDGNGGIIATWLELQYPSGAKPGEATSIGRIYVQKINANGEPAWGNSVLVYTSPNRTFAESPQIISDGSGGAIVAWRQAEAGTGVVLVQKVDANGKVLWQENGLPLNTNFSIQPVLGTDGSGGAIVVWTAFSILGDGGNLYAHRVDASGHLVWQREGINVSSDAINPIHKVISSDSGAIIASYFFTEYRKDLHVQKIGADGKAIWPDNGILVAKGDCAGYSITSDGKGGVLIGWGVGRSTFRSEKAYVQKVDSDGKFAWGNTGILLDK